MFASIFKSIGVALMSVIMAIFSAFAPPQDKPDTGSGNSGQIQQEVKISLDAAIDIAVADAGVARADAKFTEAKLDSDDLVAHYDIEFIAGANEYDYEIAVADGSILKKEVEPADPSKPSKPQPDVSGYISIDEAKAIALKKVSLDASKVTFKKAELDADDRTPHYDIEFVSGGYEYEFEIDAKSGKILEFDREREDKKPTVDTSKFISVEEAKAAALKRASLDASKVTFTKAELDADDRTPHYDIEFVSGGYEYEFEIDAKSGKILEFDREREDKKPTVDTSKFISVEEAKAAALKRASLDASKVTFTKAELDIDDRTPHYDIEFVSGGYEYEVEVNAKNGRIIDFDRELDDSKPADPSKYISADAAKKAALDHAGLTESQVTELKAELDTDSLTAHYDVEFKCGGFEYEYKINAKSGKVISFEKERD